MAVRYGNRRGSKRNIMRTVTFSGKITNWKWINTTTVLAVNAMYQNSSMKWTNQYSFPQGVKSHIHKIALFIITIAFHIIPSILNMRTQNSWPPIPQVLPEAVSRLAGSAIWRVILGWSCFLSRWMAVLSFKITFNSRQTEGAVTWWDPASSCQWNQIFRFFRKENWKRNMLACDAKLCD